jgi:hypothetical protein
MENNNNFIELYSNFKWACVEIDLANLPSNSCLRKKKFDYHPSDRDQSWITYLQKRPYQPIDHDFSKTQYEKICRHFYPTWFTEYADWLEYNILKDATYCLYCYLFKPDIEHQAGGDSFVIEGFKNWKKKEKLQNHVGS